MSPAGDAAPGHQFCTNCASGFEEDDGRCPVCWLVHATEEGALCVLDDAARRTIRDFGGLVAIFTIEPQQAHLLWCEAGLVRFDGGRGVVWSSALPGGVESVGIYADTVVVNELFVEGSLRFSARTGHRLTTDSGGPASPAVRPDR